MLKQTLVNKIVTGSVIALSLGTSGVAGYKVIASRGSSNPVPEVATPTPTPTVEPQTFEVTGELGITNNQEIEQASELVVPTAASIVPSSSPVSSDFPVAPMVGSGGFDDDGDEDELRGEDSEHDEEGEDSEKKEGDKDEDQDD